MNIQFNSSLFEDYQVLKKRLESNDKILVLVDERNQYLQKLQEVDQYSSEFLELKEKYDEVALKLSENDDYRNFKVIEREFNLFVMYCNKELEKLFDLEEKGCKR